MDVEVTWGSKTLKYKSHLSWCTCTIPPPENCEHPISIELEEVPSIDGVGIVGWRANTQFLGMYLVTRGDCSSPQEAIDALQDMLAKAMNEIKGALEL